MDKTNYLQDLTEIKNIMNRSTRFMSLSGLTGILAGIYALLGAFFASNILSEYVNTSDQSVYNLEINYISTLVEVQVQLIGIALLVAIVSIITAYILTKKKANKNGQTIWNTTSKRLLFHFAIPLLTGGMFSLIFLNIGLYGFVAGITLVFYGLALISASNFTFSNVKYLGITEIILGLTAMNYIGYGLYFWAAGFGVLHIIYGIIMYLKEEK